MFQAIFHNRLQQHAGHERFHRRIVNVLHDFQVFAAEAGHFDVQIVVNELQFLDDYLDIEVARFMLAEQPAKDVAQLQDHPPRRVRVKAN